VSDEIQTFVWRKQLKRDRDELDDLVEAPRSRRPQECLQLRERHFDRIEVGTVGREKSESRADPLNRGLHFRLFVRCQIVEDDDIAHPQRRDEDLLNVCEECRVIDRAVEDRGRQQPVDAQSGHDRVRLPMAARRVIAETHAARTAAIAAQQIGRYPRFIDEDERASVVQRLRGVPPATGGRDVRSALFVGVYGFF
jgi:hypothetical protein